MQPEARPILTGKIAWCLPVSSSRRCSRGRWIKWIARKKRNPWFERGLSFLRAAHATTQLLIYWKKSCRRDSARILAISVKKIHVSAIFSRVIITQRAMAIQVGMFFISFSDMGLWSRKSRPEAFPDNGGGANAFGVKWLADWSRSERVNVPWCIGESNTSSSLHSTSQAGGHATGLVVRVVVLQQLGSRPIDWIKSYWQTKFASFTF